MKRRVRTAAVCLLGTALCGCVDLAPKYQPPAAAIPHRWPDGTAEATAKVFGWRDIVSDERLRRAIELALANNRDLRIAVLDIERARATYRIEAAAQWPALDANASLNENRTPAQASNTGLTTRTHQYSVDVGLAAYELDLFGRVKNLKAAALESYLNTEEAERSTQLALVSEVATAWLTLAADEAQLALARDTLQTQQDSYALTQRRKALGAVSGLALVQAQTSVETARGDVAAFESQVRLDRNALQLLVGVSVSDDLLPPPMTGQSAAALVAVPGDVPSTVLERRPDVLAAEHLLKASYADIGVARAALFPQISLTAAAGTASRSLTDLFAGGAWSFAPAIRLPLFDAGANRTTVRAAQADRDIQLATYDKTIQTAFREVADALAVRGTLAERMSAQQALVDANTTALNLAQARFRSGADSYLEVLDAQRSLYQAQQGLINLQLIDQANRIALFKALGGGWQT